MIFRRLSQCVNSRTLARVCILKGLKIGTEHFANSVNVCGKIWRSIAGHRRPHYSLSISIESKNVFLLNPLLSLNSKSLQGFWDWKDEERFLSKYSTQQILMLKGWIGSSMLKNFEGELINLEPFPVWNGEMVGWKIFLGRTKAKFLEFLLVPYLKLLANDPHRNYLAKFYPVNLWLNGETIMLTKFAKKNNPIY